MKTVDNLEKADNRTQLRIFAIGMALMVITVVILAHFGVIHFDKY